MQRPSATLRAKETERIDSWRGVLSRLVRRVLVVRYWGAVHSTEGPRTWLQDRFVRAIVNERISGSQQRWPLDWFRELGLGVFDRALSLGCGTGALERDLARRGLVRTCLGLDISEAAIAHSRRAAQEAGIDCLEYQVADLDALSLPEARYDAIFFHQALHHVSRLESCLQAVRSALREGGVLYLDEYVGPSRSEWNRMRMRGVRSAFRSIPRAARRVGRVGLPVDWRDPSEAIRSSEIEDLVSGLFAPIARRPYGGNLLAPLLPNLSLDVLGDDEHRAVVERLAEQESERIAGGERSFYVVAVLRRREQGLRCESSCRDEVQLD